MQLSTIYSSLLFTPGTSDKSCFGTLRGMFTEDVSHRDSILAGGLKFRLLCSKEIYSFADSTQLEEALPMKGAMQLSLLRDSQWVVSTVLSQCEPEQKVRPRCDEGCCCGDPWV